MKIRPWFALTVLLALAAALPASAQTAADLIKQGDDLYAQLKDQAALDAYLAAVKLEPNNYEALWKTARSMNDIGELVNTEEKGGEEKQKKIYQDGASYARKAVAANPGDAEGHFYLSASLGRYALMLGKKDQIKMSYEIKAEIEKAIELDPKHDGAYHALGRWHRTMAQIGGAKRLIGGLLYGKIPKGTFQESAAALRKAIELKPDYIHHHLEFARTLMEMKEYKAALDEFQKCLDLPATVSKDADYKKEAGVEIEKARKKLK